MNDHAGLADYAELVLSKKTTARPLKGEMMTLRGGYVEGPWVVAEESVDFGDGWFVRLRRRESMTF